MHGLNGISSEVVQEVVSRRGVETRSELIFTTFTLVDRHHCWVNEALALHLAHTLLVVLPEAVSQPPLVVMIITLMLGRLLGLPRRRDQILVDAAVTHQIVVTRQSKLLNRLRSGDA